MRIATSCAISARSMRSQRAERSRTTLLCQVTHVRHCRCNFTALRMKRRHAYTKRPATFHSQRTSNMHWADLRCLRTRNLACQMAATKEIWGHFRARSRKAFSSSAFWAKLGTPKVAIAEPLVMCLTCASAESWLNSKTLFMRTAKPIAHDIMSHSPTASCCCCCHCELPVPVGVIWFLDSAGAMQPRAFRANALRSLFDKTSVRCLSISCSIASRLRSARSLR
mmetsp:Transcript_106181/g.307276  ORF Transcript_106181/g.307276 Transcript_106181/m.307276 type:complete len:224 (-) Transcript_106181:1071-1742(-)